MEQDKLTNQEMKKLMKKIKTELQTNNVITKDELFEFVRECTLQQIAKNKEIDNEKKIKDKFKKFLDENTRFKIEDNNAK